METGIASVRQLAEEMAEAFEKDGKPMPPHLAKHYWRMIGYLEREQRANDQDRVTLQEHRKVIDMIDRHMFGDKEDPDKLPGMVSEVTAIRKSSKQNRKLLWYAATVLTGCAAKAVWDMILHGHIK